MAIAPIGVHSSGTPNRGTAWPSHPGDNGHMAERLEVQRAVAASAGEIFAVLSDPRGHVSIDSSGMLMEVSGDIVAKVGDTFVVHMQADGGVLRKVIAGSLGARASGR